METRQLRPYNPERHDPVLRHHHSRGMADGHIARVMGFTVPVVTEARERLGLPQNVQRPQAVTEQTPPPPPIRQNPVAFAFGMLGARLKEHQSGGWTEYRLDGTPKRFEDIMKAANRVAKAKGQPQCGHNEEWLQ